MSNKIEAAEHLKNITSQVQPILDKNPEIYMLILVAVKINNKNKEVIIQCVHNMEEVDLRHALNHALECLNNKNVIQ